MLKHFFYLKCAYISVQEDGNPGYTQQNISANGRCIIN